MITLVKKYCSQPETGEIFHRFFYGIGANVFGQIVTIIIQLVPVPIMIHYWGMDLYGEWLLISMLPSYLALSNIGLGVVAGNDMTMRVAKGDCLGALLVFQSVWLLVIGISLIIAMIVLIIIWQFPLEIWFNFTKIQKNDFIFIVLFLLLYSLANQQTNLIMETYRCDKQYHRGILNVNLVRLIENGGAAWIVIVGGSPCDIAITLFSIRAIGTLLMGMDLYHTIIWFHWKLTQARLSIAKQFIRPALSYLAIPLSNALWIQGMTILVGIMLGPAQAVVFNTMRILTRLTLHLLSVLKQPMWPELSMAFGTKNVKLARNILKKVVQVGFILTLISTITLIFVGPWFYHLLTNGKITWNWGMFGLLQSTTLLSVLLATNSHQQLAVWRFIASIVALILAAVGMLIWSLYGVFLGLLVFEIIMIIVVLHYSYQKINEN